VTVTTSPPPGVRVDGSCDVEDTRPDIAKQRLELYWQKNDLGRKISFDFVRNRTDQLYGVERVNAVYETRRYKRAADSEIVTEFVSMTTFLMKPWEFLIPIGSSYLCKDAGTKDFHTVLRNSDDPKGDSGILLPSAQIAFKKVRLDAFRPITATTGKFQPPDNCDLTRQNLVEVLVGAALLVFLVISFTGYFLLRAGRLVRRERQFEDNEEQQLLIEEQAEPVQLHLEHEDQQEQEQVAEPDLHQEH